MPERFKITTSVFEISNIYQVSFSCAVTPAGTTSAFLTLIIQATKNIYMNWGGGWVGGWVGKGGAVRGRGRGQKHKHTIQTRQLNNMQQENIKLYKFFLKYLGLSDRVWCAVKYEQYSAKI